MKRIIRIATRQSKLALWQSHFVKAAIEKKYPDISIELVCIVTEGDKQQNIPLVKIGGKSVFVKALQHALLKNEADIAVHSVKDMSVFPDEKLLLAAICERGDARDAFLSTQYKNIDELPKNAIVGTASPRRTALIKSLRPDVQIKLLRGNVDTRLQKLKNGEYDGIILAAAGVTRLGFAENICEYLSEDFFTPAIGQGAIGIECRESDDFIREKVHFLNHEITEKCVQAERVVNQILGGNCHTAIGAYAKIIERNMQLSAMIGSEDGTTILRAKESTVFSDAKNLATMVAENLLSQGAKDYLHA